MPEGMSPQEEAPFSPPLEKDIFHDPRRHRDTRLQGIESRDDVVVRVETLPVGKNANDEMHPLRAEYHKDHANKEAKEAYLNSLDKTYKIEEINRYKEYLDFLKSDYGIENSGYHGVIGPNSEMGGARRYVVTNMIDGVSVLYNPESVPDQALLSTFRKIIDYYIDVCSNGGLYNPDLRVQQFVYDTNLQEMILVDHEASDTHRIKPADSKLKAITYKRLNEGLRYIENRLGKEFPDLRQRIAEALRQS